MQRSARVPWLVAWLIVGSLLSFVASALAWDSPLASVASAPKGVVTAEPAATTSAVGQPRGSGGSGGPEIRPAVTRYSVIPGTCACPSGEGEDSQGGGDGYPMTIPAVSRRNIAIRLAATVWMSSARTTRGRAISSKTPARERTVKPIVRPALPRGGRMTRT
jgi:hypothetical protein